MAAHKKARRLVLDIESYSTALKANGETRRSVRRPPQHRALHGYILNCAIRDIHEQITPPAAPPGAFTHCPVCGSSPACRFRCLPVAKPESVGMSSTRLERIDDWLRGLVDRKQAAGFVSLVARRGKVVHHKAFGTRGLQVAEPMPIDAKFDLASMTKPITVVAALMLLEEGRYTLSDSISVTCRSFGTPKWRWRRASCGCETPDKREGPVHPYFRHNDPRSRAETMNFRRSPLTRRRSSSAATL